MLVNVKFYKIFTIFILLSVNLSADEKDQIVTQLNNLKSLEFTFNQVVNEKTEKGSCLLEFPGKLKCDYFDDKKKELIINKKRLAITQKRYNKTYYYPISKSPFLNILYKDKLLEIVKSGKLELSDRILKLVYFRYFKGIFFKDVIFSNNVQREIYIVVILVNYLPTF